MTFKKTLNMRLEFKGRCMYLLFPKEMYPKFRTTREMYLKFSRPAKEEMYPKFLLAPVEMYIYIYSYTPNQISCL